MACIRINFDLNDKEASESFRKILGGIFNEKYEDIKGLRNYKLDTEGSENEDKDMVGKAISLLDSALDRLNEHFYITDGSTITDKTITTLLKEGGVKDKLLELFQMYEKAALKFPKGSLRRNSCEDIATLKDFVIKTLSQKYGLLEHFLQDPEDKTVGDFLERDKEDKFSLFYNNAKAARAQFLERTKIQLLGVTFIDFKRMRVISTTKELNDALADFKSKQFNILLKFLRDKVKVSMSRLLQNKRAYLYSLNRESVNTLYLKELLIVAKKYFDSNYDSNRISMIYRNPYYVNPTVQDQNEEPITNQDIIEAYEAYVLLHEQLFDAILQLLVKNINIRDTHGVTKPPIWVGARGEVLYKYRFGLKNNYYKNWTELDLDASTFTGNVASMIIESIPERDIYGNIIEGKYLTKLRVFNVMSMLKDPRFINQLAPEYSSKLKNLHKTPLTTYREIIQALLADLDSFTKVTEGMDINVKEAFKVLKSFYMHILRVKSKEELKNNPNTERSLYEIDLAQIQASKVAKSYFLTEAVIGALLRTTNASYTTYQRIKETGRIGAKEIEKRETDKFEINLRNRLDMEGDRFSITERRSLIRDYGITIEGSIVRFEIGGLSKQVEFTFNSNNFNSKNPWAKVTLEQDFAQTLKTAILTGNVNQLQGNIKIVYNMLLFIEDMLGIPLTTPNVIDVTLEYFDLYKQKALTGLILLATNAARNHVALVAYDDYINSRQSSEDTTPPLSLTQFVVQDQDFTKNVTNFYAEPQSLNQRIDFDNTRLRVYNTSADLVTTLQWAQADQLVSGLFYKINFRNALGNTIAAQKMGNLASLLEFQIQERIKNNPESALHKNLLATNLGQFKGMTIKTDYKITEDIKKTAADFTESEHAYSAIMYDFYGTLASGILRASNSKAPIYPDISSVRSLEEFNKLKKSLMVLFQITTYSDKVTIYLARTGTLFWIDDGKNPFCIDITRSSSEDLLKAILVTIGGLYIDIYNKVMEDYRYVLRDSVIESVLLNNNSDSKAKKILKIIDDYKQKGWKHWSYILNNENIETILSFMNTTLYQELSYFDISNLERSLMLHNESNGKLIIKDVIKDFYLKGIVNQDLELAENAERLVHHFRSILNDNILLKYLQTTESENSEEASFKEELILLNKSLKGKKGISIISNLSQILLIRLIEYLGYDRYVELNTVDHNHCIAELHYSKKKVKINNLLKVYATQLYNNKEVLRDRLLLEKLKFIKNIIQYRLNFDKTEDIYNALEVIGIASEEELLKFLDNWRDINTGRLIIAKVQNENGSIIDNLTFFNLEEYLREPDIYKNIILNPLLEQYFMADFLLGENTRLATTGASFVHKDTHKADSEKSVLEDAIYEQAARESSLYKRLVIIPATLLYFLLDSVTGTPQYINSAVIPDVKAYMWNLNGLCDSDGSPCSEDAHDGSGYDHPVWDALQNMALLDCAVGSDKKNIGHALSPYGTAILKKYAVFSAYNERMRKSMFSPNSLYLLVKTLSTAISFRDVMPDMDLTKGLYGLDLKITDLSETPIYFRRGNNHYKLLEIKKVEGDNFLYIRRLLRMEKDLITHEYLEAKTEAAFEEGPIKVENMWDLMNLFGGIYSEDLKEEGFEFGGANILLTANYINNIGHYHGPVDEYGNPTELPTQSNTSLPLKTAYVHTTTNVSGLKNNQDNVNSKEVWLPSVNKKVKVRYMVMDTFNLGPQMDADHIVVGGDHLSEASEPTQIISALEANGRAHDISRLAYKDLGKLALHAIAHLNSAVKNFIESGYSTSAKSDLYHEVGDIIIKAILKDDEKDIAAPIIKAINKEFLKSENHENDEFKLPLSSASLFSKTLAEFTSTINKSAIKRKFPGEGAVMVPAYNIMTYIRINGVEYTLDDIYTEAYREVEKGELPDGDPDTVMRAWLTKLQELLPMRTDFEEIMPGDKILVTILNQDGNPEEIFLDLENYDNYLMLKDPMFRNKDDHRFDNVLRYRKAIYKNGTLFCENLRPLETSWKYKDANGVTHKRNIYDLYLVRDAILKRRQHAIYSKEDSKYIKAIEQDKKKLRDLELERDTSSDPEVIKKISKLILTLSKEINTNINKHNSIAKYILTKKDDLNILESINRALDCLHRGYMPIDPVKYSTTGEVDSKTGLRVLKIEEGSLHTEAAEMIMSGIYLEQFNLKPGVSLADIKNNPDYFKENINTLPATECYDLCFLRNNGKHTYITTLVRDDMEMDEYTYENIQNFVVRNGKIYRVNSLGNIMYQLGEYVETDEVDNKTGKKKRAIKYYVRVYKDSNNNEILLVDDLAYLPQLFNPHEYTGILVNPDFDNNPKLEDILHTLEENPKFSSILEDVNNIKGASTIYELFKQAVENNKDRLARLQYVSFLTSLEYTVGRIPAQSLQSFMKMKCVALLNTNKNIVHVSHYLTWLLGSDYDIDKAYILGYTFNNNGTFATWSPYFDLTSKEGLDLSMLLPTPNGTKYEWSDSKNALNITELIREIEDPETVTDSQRRLDNLRLLINLLSAVDEAGEITYNTEQITPELAELALNIINLHNSFFFNEPNAASGGFKNSVSSKMQRVVSDVRNLLSAYSPIGMDDPREAADNSKAGDAVKTMTSMDPFTKFIMTVQNMSGKKVIGIAATGEKIFFALSYYYNEMVKRNDLEWMKNAFFKLVLYKMNMVNTNIESLTEMFKHTIANVNFLLNPQALKRWKELIAVSYSDIGDENERLQYINLALQNDLGLQPDQSLVISALLSAATDNAKELILDKINAGPELAGFYLHMIIMGMDFLDISRIMTSDTMYAIKELYQTNAFDGTTYKKGNLFNWAVKVVDNGPEYLPYFKDLSSITLAQIEQLNKYIKALIIRQVTEKNKDKNLTQDQLQDIIDKQYESKEVKSGKKYIKTLKEIFSLICNSSFVLLDRDNSTISPILLDPSVKDNGVNKFLEDYLKIAKILQVADLDTLNKIKEIKKLSDITTSLGQAILSANQGFATDLASKISKSLLLEALMTNAEKEIKNSLGLDLTDPNNKSKIKAFVTYAKKCNPLLSESEILEIYGRAKLLGVMQTFDILEFFNNEEYQKVTILYYNCLKTTFNVFDIIVKLPHFNAIYKAYNVINTVDNNLSLKYQYVRSITRRLVRENLHSSYYSEAELKKLIKAVDAELICRWLETLKLTLRLAEGADYLDSEGNIHPVEKEYVIDFTSDEGCATFKLFMEKILAKTILRGYITDGQNIRRRMSLQVNKFVLNLIPGELEDKTSGVRVPFLRTSTDMVNHQNKFAQIDFEDEFKGIRELHNIQFFDSGLSLYDLFFLYNLITNLDLYGADRLTSLFGLDINGSLALKYYLYVGEQDFETSVNSSQDFSEFMESSDILLSMASICSPQLIDSLFSKYVICRHGRGKRTSLWKRNDNGNSEIDPEFMDFIDGLSDFDGALQEYEEGFNRPSKQITSLYYSEDLSYKAKPSEYFKYFTLRRPFKLDVIRRLHILDEHVDNIDSHKLDLTNILIRLIGRNTLVVNFNCK